MSLCSFTNTLPGMIPFSYFLFDQQFVFPLNIGRQSTTLRLINLHYFIFIIILKVSVIYIFILIFRFSISLFNKILYLYVILKKIQIWYSINFQSDLRVIYVNTFSETFSTFVYASNFLLNFVISQ